MEKGADEFNEFLKLIMHKSEQKYNSWECMAQLYGCTGCYIG